MSELITQITSEPVAGATLIVAISTLVLAFVTVQLGRQTKRLADSTASDVAAGAAAENDRRSEVAVTTADPLNVVLDTQQTEPDADRWPRLRVVVSNKGPRIVTAITATIRTDDPDGPAESPARDFLIPGGSETFRFALRPFLTAGPDLRNLRAAYPILRIDVESFGLLRQRVFQTFTFRNDRVYGGGGDVGPVFYQSRLQIIPAHPGATATDIVANIEEGTVPPEAHRAA